MFGGVTYNTADVVEAKQLAMAVAAKLYDPKVYDIFHIADKLVEQKARHLWKLTKEAVEYAVMHTEGPYGAFNPTWFAEQGLKKMAMLKDKLEIQVKTAADAIFNKYAEEVEDLGHEAEEEIAALFDNVQEQLQGKVHATMAKSSFFGHMRQAHRKIS